VSELLSSNKTAAEAQITSFPHLLTAPMLREILSEVKRCCVCYVKMMAIVFPPCAPLSRHTPEFNPITLSLVDCLSVHFHVFWRRRGFGRLFDGWV